MTNEESSSQEFNSYIQKNIRTLAESIKAASVLPIGSVRNNFNTCFPTFTSELKPYSDQVLDMVSTLLRREGIRQNIEDTDNDGKIELVVDGVNKILDRVRDNLNVLNGVKSIPIVAESLVVKDIAKAGSWNKDQKRSVIWKANHEENIKKPMQMQKVLEKPQLKFEHKIDNTDSPFKPSLQNKPNSIKPLAIYLERNADGFDHYCHPYLHELNSFQVPEQQLQKAEPIPPAEMNSSHTVFVDNEELLNNMVTDLKNEKELAIDLEYHSYRSFQGFTCLLQISTRTKDYIIDTIVLRDKLQVLNEFFTDPKVLKVLHGASSDVIWLQKDLNLYLVNMFDTHLASTMLNFPRLSLAFLLKHYCNVETDKRYQLYDWRIRPLPDAAMEYARCDTHYLLNIYDQLRNALIDQASGLSNILLSVYNRSTELCKKRHEKTFDGNNYLQLCNQSKQSFDARQMHAMKLLYEWRDKIAREKDESIGFVLPNHMLMQIAEILPREMQGILACCNPVPVLVRQNLFHLHQLITEARNKPVNKMSNHPDNESIAINKRPSLSKLKCPHDFSYHDDFRDNLTTLLDSTDVIKSDEEQTNLKLSVFDDNANIKAENDNQNREAKLKSVTFVSPYERYRRTVDFVLAQAEKESREKKTDNEKTEIEQHQKLIPVELEENVHIFNYKTKKNEESNTKKEDTTSKVPVAEKIENTEQKPSEKSVSPASSSAVAATVTAVKCKQKILSEQMTNKKFAKNYDIIAETAVAAKRLHSAQSRADDDEFPELENGDETTEMIDSEPPAKKKKNRKKKKQVRADDVNAQAATGSGFKPFDYEKANYDKFVSAGPKNLKALLNSKITFGTKKKNKNQNRQQNQKFQKQRRK